MMWKLHFHHKVVVPLDRSFNPCLALILTHFNFSVCLLLIGNTAVILRLLSVNLRKVKHGDFFVLAADSTNFLVSINGDALGSKEANSEKAFFQR